MSTYKEKIETFFENERLNMVNDICELIKIPSVVKEIKANEKYLYGPEAAKVLDVFIQMGEKLGFKTKNLEYRAAYVSYGPEPRKLDFLGHLDVVDATDDWIVTNPFEPCVIDGKIYGRGSADDKGPSVAALYALYAIKELGIPLKRGVRIVMGANEENGTRDDLKYYLEKEQEAEFTISPDADYPIINVEKGFLRGKTVASFAPTDHAARIISIDSGSKRWIIPGIATVVIRGLSKQELVPFIEQAKTKNDIKVDIEAERNDGLHLIIRGKESNVGSPELGNNAISGAIDFLCNLPLEDCEGLNLLRGINHIYPHGDWEGNAAGIARSTDNSGNLISTYNIFHYKEDGITGSFDCKIPVGCTDENTKNVLITNLGKIGLKVLDCELEPAHYIPLEGEFVNTLLKLYTEYSGKEAFGVTINGNTYVHNMDRGVAFGCAMQDIDNHMHSADEFVNIDVLIMSAKIFTRAIIEFCAE